MSGFFLLILQSAILRVGSQELTNKSIFYFQKILQSFFPHCIAHQWPTEYHITRWAMKYKFPIDF